MSKLAGRSTLLAALAVPFVMVVAPLTASADAPEAGAIATSEGAAALHTPWYPALHPAGAWYHGTMTQESEVDTEDGETEEVIESEVESAAVLPTQAPPAVIEVEDDVVEDEAIEVEAVEVEDDHEVQVVEIVEDDNVTFAVHEDVEAGAGQDGAWVSSTESGAFSENGLSNDTAAWYREVTAAAGDEGAFVESTESVAVNGDVFGHDFDDDGSFAAYEEHAAAAGQDGAWVSNTSSAAGELD